MIHAIKAFATPKKIPQSCIFCFTDLNALPVSLKAAFSVDILFLKQYCSVTSMLLVCRCWLNPLCTVFLNTLEKKS